MAILIFTQTLGGAVFLNIANTIFDSSLRSKLLEHVPSLDLDKIIAAGANGFRPLVSADELPGVLQSYSDSLALVFWISVATACCVCVLAWGMGWKDLRETARGSDPEASKQR